MRKADVQSIAGGALLALAALGLAAGLTACRTAKYPEGLYAEVATNKGLIVLKLDLERVPMTVANFVGLAEGTIANTATAPGRPFFDGTQWHRVVPGHVIQCGMGPGGAEGPGYEFPNEIVSGPGLDHGRAGVLGMANGGPHTNGSQWYITLGDRSYLDGDYTVFGEVAAGLDVVNAVAQGDDVVSVRIVRVGQAAGAFRPSTASFQAMVEAAKAGVVKADAERRAREDEYVRTAWPAAVRDEGGFESVVLTEGRGEAPRPGAVVTAVYTGTAPFHGKSFVSTADEGKPYWAGTPAEPFGLTVGTPRVNPGFDAAIARMKKGEKRVVIVRPEQGYTANGFYARQRPGEMRFVLSPHTLLVYEIEVLDIVPAKR
ncbi:MAG: peptidylprolyl isomerase [Candidatus Aminicenantes bacterium]|nr:peptidylprolyl isomerase [Candidatus Aminicenantes bacterium]